MSHKVSGFQFQLSFPSFSSYILYLFSTQFSQVLGVLKNIKGGQPTSHFQHLKITKMNCTFTQLSLKHCTGQHFQAPALGINYLNSVWLFKVFSAFIHSYNLMKEKESGFSTMCLRMSWEHVQGLQDQKLQGRAVMRHTIWKVMSEPTRERPIELVTWRTWIEYNICKGPERETENKHCMCWELQIIKCSWRLVLTGVGGSERWDGSGKPVRLRLCRAGVPD